MSVAQLNSHGLSLGFKRAATEGSVSNRQAQERRIDRRLASESSIGFILTVHSFLSHRLNLYLLHQEFSYKFQSLI